MSARGKLRVHEGGAVTPLRHATDTAPGGERLRCYEGKGADDGGTSEALDGSRNLGYLAREGGQYGSFPLHDDYGDEASAEGKDYGDYPQ
jgi:hypothetical protein